MKNKGLIAIIVVLIAVIITLIAVVFLMQMPTIMSVDGFSNKTANKKETFVVSTMETVESTRETETETTTIPTPKVTTRIENYVGYKDHVRIDYPVIEGMDDKDLQARINEKIKTNALSVVPLYPISTALQNLEVSCEIKTFNEDHITIIYEGRVVGRTNRGESSGSSTGNRGSSNYNSATKDPYLDGFVDPLGVYGQLGRTSVAPTTSFSYSVSTTVYNSNVEIYSSGKNTKVPAENSSGTSDSGPTVKTITSPTAENKAKSTYIDNTAANNPYNTGSSAVTNPTSKINSAPSNSTDTVYKYPVFGFSNTSVSNIDQKIYYTNTVDLRTGLDVSLKDYINDFEKLSKWLRSSKVEFVNVDESSRKAVREYVNLTVQSRYETQMKNADFQNKGLKEWPKIFSYKDSDGTVYFSVKLSSKLGNYALVKYKP